MVRTIGFNDQATAEANKIHNVFADWELAPKLHILKPMPAQEAPKCPFCVSVCSPKGPGAARGSSSILFHH
jgi:hypothetical protein